MSWKRMSVALAESFEEALTALRASGLAHIDETPWKKRGVLHWLWTGVGDEVPVHRIDRRRNRGALEVQSTCAGALFGAISS